MLLVSFNYSTRVASRRPTHKEISHASAVTFETADAAAVPSRNDAQSGFARRAQLMKLAHQYLRSNPLVAARYAERLLEIAPDDYPALRLALVARYQDAKNNNNAKAWQLVKEYLERAKRQGYQDELFLSEMAYWVAEGQQDDVAARDQVKVIATKYRAFGLGQFLTACNELRNQHESVARHSFRLAAEIEPEQRRYWDAYDASKVDTTSQYATYCDVPPWEWPEWSDTAVK